MRINSIILLIYFLLTGIIFAQNNHLSNQINCDTAHFHFEDYIDSMNYYETQMGAKKNLSTNDERLKLAFYVALNRYPELYHTRITLKHKPISSTMQAQPSPDFLFKRKSKRAYRIFVNNNPNLTGINYEELSFNGLVGWIGHEFAHLIDYNSMNNRALLSFIGGYLFDKRTMRRTERNADRETIKRGLGIQLLDGVAFFEKNNKVSKKYRRRKQKNYLSEAEIIVDIERNCH
ncbi:MAG: hypothetical protein CL855_05725 [Cryomorphaceae bacterium]|nr:hypothetical protein [Cryomorphaceae bacterium]